jgi:hypothetical protein
MESNSALTALFEKQSDLIAERDDLECRLEALQVDLEAIERVIRLLDPEHEFAAKPRRRHRAAFDAICEPREISRLVMDTLRRSDGPLTSAACSAALSALNGIPSEDARMRVVRRKVGIALYHLTQRGILVKAPDAHGRATWTVDR